MSIVAITRWMQHMTMSCTLLDIDICAMNVHIHTPMLKTTEFAGERSALLGMRASIEEPEVGESRGEDGGDGPGPE